MSQIRYLPPRVDTLGVLTDSEKQSASDNASIHEENADSSSSGSSVSSTSSRSYQLFMRPAPSRKRPLTKEKFHLTRCGGETAEFQRRDVLSSWPSALRKKSRVRNRLFLSDQNHRSDERNNYLQPAIDRCKISPECELSENLVSPAVLRDIRARRLPNVFPSQHRWDETDFRWAHVANQQVASDPDRGSQSDGTPARSRRRYSRVARDDRQFLLGKKKTFLRDNATVRNYYSKYDNMALLRRSGRPASELSIDGSLNDSIVNKRSWQEENTVSPSTIVGDLDFSRRLSKKLASEHGWLGLARTHVFVMSLMIFMTVLGSSFSSQKWTRLSPRFLDIPLKNVRDSARTAAGGGDFDFARRVLFDESRSAESDLLSVSEFFEFGRDDDPKLSIFIPSDEKRRYRDRRKSKSSTKTLPKFSMALICSNIQIRLLGGSSQPSDQLFPQQVKNLEDMLAAVCVNPLFDGASRIPLRDDYESPSNSFLSRRCSLWLSPEYDHKSHQREEIPRLVKWSMGVLSPNYIMFQWLEAMAHNPMYSTAFMALVWAHSLGLPQPISVVHGPRLIFYMIALIWRYGVLYHGLGFIERIPLIQTFLTASEIHMKMTKYWIELPTADRQFDFSDHIVLYCLFSFILATEGFCLWEFRRKGGHMGGDEDQASAINFAIPYSSSKEDDGRKNAESVALTKDLSSMFDIPFRFPSVLPVVTAICIYLSIVILAYACFVTSSFYHSPLESGVSILIAIVCIYSLFWFITIVDWGISKHYFGLIFC